MPPECEKAIELRQAIGRGEVKKKKRKRGKSYYKECEKVSKTCVCGREFSAKIQQVYCSQECKYKERKRIEREKRLLISKPIYENKCHFCGQMFKTHIRRTLYCSDKCKVYRNNTRLDLIIELEERTCKVCGNKFKPKRSLMNYCSTKCKNKHNAEKCSDSSIGARAFVKTKCPICGKIYERFFPSGWIGNGMPRKNCYTCIEILNDKPSYENIYAHISLR